MSWEKVKLGEVTESCLGKMLDQKKNKGSYKPYLANVNVRWGFFDLDNLQEMRFEDDEDEKYGIKYGDLIICEGGEPGRCAIWKEQIPNMKIQKALHRVRVHDIMDFRFVYYWFLLAGKQGALKQYYTGATIMHMPGQKLREVLIDKPPLIVQQRIGAYLETFDNLIENNQKQIKLLEEAAQRLYKEWFVDLRFPGYENCKIVDGVPVEWKKKKLDEIADVIMGQSPKSEFYNKEHKGLPFHQGVGSYGARFVQDDTYSTSFTKVAEANSILFSVRAPVGRLNITKNKIVIGRGIAAINSKSGFQSYLFYALKERFFKDDILGNGAIFASISKNELLNQVFVIPDAKIMSAYEKIAAALDKKIEVVDMQLQQLVEARDRLLPKLMNGEIEV
ncbi:restriction endonuclease subunit S [Roseburia faecis]|jgi:type I restriction enzyme S subunit|uniref:restriction endonuclease subunit S n=1 Tax=Roseburia faecis TaxID=301302 RepID=UPI0032EBBFDA